MYKLRNYLDKYEFCKCKILTESYKIRDYLWAYNFIEYNKWMLRVIQNNVDFKINKFL